jgi:hypothetical protein
MKYADTFALRGLAPQGQFRKPGPGSRWCAQALALLSLALILGVAPGMAAEPVVVVVDGQFVAFDQPPLMVGGRVLVPLRGVFERLGATVVWEPATRSIRASRGSRAVALQIGSSQALIDGQPTLLDTPALVAGGRTLVPLRFLSEAMGAEVVWRAATRTVLISSQPPGGPGTQPSPPPSASPPQIQSITHNGARLSPGQNLSVTVQGTPGGSASFDVLGTSLRRVSMIEVSPGRYEGNIGIPQGTAVSSGVLVVRLRKDGQEAVEQAPTPVVIAASTPPAGDLVLTPAPGSTVSTRQPTLEITVPARVRSETVRLMLNGVDVTSYAQLLLTGPRSVVRFTPGYKLHDGVQNVSFQATDEQGQLHQRDWTFNVSLVAAPEALQVTLGSPSPGAEVGPSLTVTGTTRPYAQVKVTARVVQQLIPGVVGLELGRLEGSASADASGAFSVPLDLSSAPVNARILLSATARDSAGQVATSPEITVTRR